jgi:hypothetical protein
MFFAHPYFVEVDMFIMFFYVGINNFHLVGCAFGFGIKGYDIPFFGNV